MTQQEDTVQEPRDKALCNIAVRRHSARRWSEHTMHEVRKKTQREQTFKEDIVQDGRVLKAQCEQTLIKHCARLHRKDVMQADLKKEEKRPSCHNIITLLREKTLRKTIWRYNEYNDKGTLRDVLVCRLELA